MELYEKGDTVPHPLFGFKSDVSDLDNDSEIVAIKPLIEALTTEVRQLHEVNEKIQEVVKNLQKENLEILDKLDTQKILTKELFIRLSAIEDGEIETVPLSSTNIGNMIEYQGYDKTIIKALMYLEKKSSLYVKDLKRLDIKFKHNRQYIRFLLKLGEFLKTLLQRLREGYDMWLRPKKKKTENVTLMSPSC